MRRILPVFTVLLFCLFLCSCSSSGAEPGYQYERKEESPVYSEVQQEPTAQPNPEEPQTSKAEEESKAEQQTEPKALKPLKEQLLESYRKKQQESMLQSNPEEPQTSKAEEESKAEQQTEPKALKPLKEQLLENYRKKQQESMLQSNPEEPQSSKVEEKPETDEMQAIKDHLSQNIQNSTIKLDSEDRQETETSIKPEAEQRPQTGSKPAVNTVACTSCGGSGTCSACYGYQSCMSCDGSGKTRCWTCLGDGECLYCSGDGGSYEYNFYSGESEWTKCSTCYGSGNCYSCHGSREVTCSSCYGSGGSCNYCFNSGRCSLCGGTGTVTEYSSGTPVQTAPGAVQESSAAVQENLGDRTENVLFATIDGTEYSFILVSAEVLEHTQKSGTYIRARYQAKDIHGNMLYDMYLCLDSATTCGTHEFIGDNYALDMGCSLTQSNTGISFHSTRSGTPVTVGSWTVSEMGTTGNVYSGSFKAKLQPSGTGQTVQIEAERYHFIMS